MEEGVKLDSKVNILIVEDDSCIGNIIATLLSSNGYGVMRAATGKEAISLTAIQNPELVLLDLGLPDIDGMNVIKSIRSWTDIPILIVSARTREEQKVEALDAGADDYITKPFGNQELLARIRKALRTQCKINGISIKTGLRERFSQGDLIIDYNKRVVTRDGNRIHFTPIEYKIVVLLSQNAGRVLSHDHIIQHVWGPYESDSQVLRVNMANIRRKIENKPSDPQYILTEVGVGYRMIDTEDA
jgi:two-component system KDP operon response regulator KdpE